MRQRRQCKRLQECRMKHTWLALVISSPVTPTAQEAAPWSPAAQPALAVALREQLDEYHMVWEALGGRAPRAFGPAPAVPDGQTCRDYHPECAQWAAQARHPSLDLVSKKCADCKSGPSQPLGTGIIPELLPA